MPTRPYTGTSTDSDVGHDSDDTALTAATFTDAVSRFGRLDSDTHHTAADVASFSEDGQERASGDEGLLGGQRLEDEVEEPQHLAVYQHSAVSA